MGDLMRHYPRRYETRGELTDLASLADGEYVTVQAEVAKVTSRPMRNRRGSIFEATVTDGHGMLVLTFFGRGRQDWRERQLTPGVLGLFSGQVSTFRGKRQLAHPEYELLDAGEDAAHAAAEYAAEMIPVYPAAKEITSWQIARSVRVVLDVLDVEDPMPRAIRDRHGLCGLADALRGIHRPVDWADVQRSRNRLKWDEAFLLQVVLAQRRLAAAAYSATPRPRAAGGLLDAYDARLPFELTVGQQLAGAQIADELALDHAMHRLLQGEVGSGKTVIAVRAMLQVVDGGGQAALLAPTEVLAQQHYRSITEQLGPLGQAGELGGAETATRRRAADRLPGRRGAPARPARGGVGHGRNRDRHPRAARGAGAVRRPRPRRDRRAAPVRRGAARCAAGQGGRGPSAPSRHDRHPDTPDGGDDGLRRPGDVHADRAARRALADRHARGPGRREAALPRAHLAAAARGGGARPPVLRGLPAYRRRPGQRFRPGYRGRRPGR